MPPVAPAGRTSGIHSDGPLPQAQSCPHTATTSSASRLTCAPCFASGIIQCSQQAVQSSRYQQGVVILVAWLPACRHAVSKQEGPPAAACTSPSPWQSFTKCFTSRRHCTSANRFGRCSLGLAGGVAACSHPGHR